MGNNSGKAKQHWLLLAVQGALVGSGAILPGISGGVLCVAFGIYEPLMAFLAHPFRSFKTYYKMFIPIGVGGCVGFVLLARAVELLFGASATVAMALFGGLIFGTVPGLIKRSEQSGPGESWSPLVISMAAVFVLLGFLGGSALEHVTPSTAWYVFCGAVWGLSMILPGLSSSSILIFMGLYQPMTAGIGSLNFGVIIPVGCGGLAAVLLAARVINSLLETRYAFISRVVLGVMISSSLLILPTSFTGIGAAMLSLCAFAAGFYIACRMDSARSAA